MFLNSIGLQGLVEYSRMFFLVHLMKFSWYLTWYCKEKHISFVLSAFLCCCSSRCNPSQFWLHYVEVFLHPLSFIKHYFIIVVFFNQKYDVYVSLYDGSVSANLNYCCSSFDFWILTFGLLCSRPVICFVMVVLILKSHQCLSWLSVNNKRSPLGINDLVRTQKFPEN